MKKDKEELETLYERALRRTVITLNIFVWVAFLGLAYNVTELKKSTDEQIEALEQVVVEQTEEIHTIQGWVVDLSYDLLDALDEYDQYFEGYDADNRTDELSYLKSLLEEQDKY